MAIPKRVLRRAIDRNTVRRIAREAWRAALAARVPDPPDTGLPEAADAPRNAGHGVEAARPRTMLLRLLRRPAGFAALGYRARKRLWRSELDALFARAGGGPAGNGATGNGPSPAGARHA